MGELNALRREVHSLRARYESADTTHENQPLWRYTDYLSAKAANSFQVRRTLKIRSRYEADNNSYFRGIVNTMANDLVGSGPRLHLQTDDESTNQAVQKAWAAWAKAVHLPLKLRTMAKAKVVDGEAFALLVTNKNLSRTLGGQLDIDDAVQLDVAVVESDQCMTPDAGFVDQYWVDGIVMDQLGNPREYHFLRHHPGDLFMPTLNPMIYDKWKPQHVLHWFRQDRPGQVRGVPEITPALDLFAQLRRYTKAVIRAAETAADIAAYIESEGPAFDETATDSPFDHMPIDRGMLLRLPWKTKISQLKAEQPATTYEMFVRVLIREVCRCLQIPLNLALGDSSGFNYSSGRLDHLGYHRQQRIDRSLCAETILSKIFTAWLDEAVMIPGLLPRKLRMADIPHRWLWNGAESIDPVKQAQAEQIDLENGTTTLADIFAERGEDWQASMKQRAKEKELAKKLGLQPMEVAPPTPMKANARIRRLQRKIAMLEAQLLEGRARS
jgi:lambda family phage portal protein